MTDAADTAQGAPRSVGAGEAIDDFRVRSARRRRERTSRRLCEATLRAVGELGPATVDIDIGIDDICRRADLSHGAFYRYFPALDALLDHLAGAVGAQLNAEMSDRFESVPDPALRIALFVRYQVSRVMTDRACALLLSRALSLHGTTSVFAREHAREDFTDAVATGRFDVDSLDVALDLAHGILAAILRRATSDGLDPARLSSQTAFLITACGVPRAEAHELAGHPLQHLPTADLSEAVLRLCSPD